MSALLRQYDIADFLYPAKNLYPFHINKLEGMERAYHIERPHKHNFYEIFLIKKGNINQSVDYQNFTLEDNSLFFISKGQLHIWQTTENAEQGYRLMFTEDFLMQYIMHENFLFELIYLDNVYQNPFLKLHLDDSLIITYFDCLYQEFNKPDVKEATLSALLYVLLSEIQRLFKLQIKNSVQLNDVIVYKKFVQLLEKNLTQNLSVQDYAKMLFISPRHLNRVVQNIAYQSPTKVIQHRIVLEAKRLLTFTALNINEIATHLGFEDTSYFARYFKKIENMSPIEFKSNMSEKYRHKTL